MRAELVGLSDDDLAARARDADPETLAMLAAEANRRDMLADLYPGGNLLAELSEMGDDELAWCMQYATADEFARIAAEMDRGDAVDLPQPADTGDVEGKAEPGMREFPRHGGGAGGTMGQVETRAVGRLDE